MNRHTRHIYFNFIFFISSCQLFHYSVSSEDYYTSLYNLQKLVLFEQDIIQALGNYVTNLENRIQLAKRYLNDYETSVLTSSYKPQITVRDKKSHSATGTKEKKRNAIETKKEGSESLVDKITAHPLMTFRLIRRFAQDLTDIEKNLRKDHEKGFLRILEKTRKGQVLPKVEDVNGATEALLRVQDAYDVEVTDFANGKFVEFETHSGLTAADMNYIGVYSLNANIYTRAIEWLLAAYQRATKEQPPTVSSQVVFEQMQKAIAMHNKVRNMMPKNPYVFQSPIYANMTNWNARKRVLDTKRYQLYVNEDSVHDLTNFAALCRGEILRSPKMNKGLRCWLDTRGTTFILDPIKVEKHHDDPPVLQYYDILSDSTVETILEKTASRMARSKVQGIAKNSEIVSAVRTSTTTWISEKEHRTIVHIPRLTEMITGMNLVDQDSAEDLQVTSYGIGGHYNPHYDNIFNQEFMSTMEREEISKGDRMGSVLFYLSSVDAGGGTAFPKLGVVTQAVKGSAIFWYNMKRNGDKEKLALHGGCPILFGKKIVANKWIRANSQMFTRKCFLSEQA